MCLRNSGELLLDNIALCPRRWHCSVLCPELRKYHVTLNTRSVITTFMFDKISLLPLVALEFLHIFPQKKKKITLFHMDVVPELNDGSTE
jgi:hypothetical protein